MRFTRYAIPKDRMVFVELAQERDRQIGKPGRLKYWETQFRTLIRQKQLLLAFSQGTCAGFCYFSPFLFPENKDQYVQLIYVSERYRRQGLARILMARVAAVTRRKGAARLFSSCDWNNRPSLYMHRQLGFEKCGSIKGITKNRLEVFFVKGI